MPKALFSKKRCKRLTPSVLLDDIAPLPEGPGAMSDCGHSKCGEVCNVRYVGPVSNLHDHHALHAARGVGHIWAASIITGFAIVLTGVLAYTAAEARTAANPYTQNATRADIEQVLERLDAIEQRLR